MKYLDPKADLTFKKVFGEHPELVKSLLNALLPFKSEEEEITSVTYLTPEMVPQTPTRKYSIVDVRCEDTQGRQFIVEMQMVIVVIIIQFRLKYFINQIERIDWLQKRIVFSPVQLLYICLGSIEENSLLKLRRPNHLHLNNKLTSLGILASHIHYAIFSCGCLGNHLRRKICHRSDFFFLTLKRKKGVKQRVLFNASKAYVKQLNRGDRKSTRLNSSHAVRSRMPSSA